jgi:hypothetical protein
VRPGLGLQARVVRVLLTVPHLESTASHYRHMMSIAQHLPRDRFSLEVCYLRDNGRDRVVPLLVDLVARAFVARYRPRANRFFHL